MEENTKLLIAEELAIVLNCSTPLIHKLKKNRKIPFIKIGHLLRFKAEDVIKQLQANTE